MSDFDQFEKDMHAMRAGLLAAGNRPALVDQTIHTILTDLTKKIKSGAVRADLLPSGEMVFNAEDLMREYPPVKHRQ